MALYRCKVIDPLGKNRVVQREAGDEESLRAELKRDGFVPLRLSFLEEKKPNVFFSVSSKVKMSEVIPFLRQFAVLVKASVPIAQALDILRKQKHTKAFQKVLLEVSHDVRSGVSLSDSFGRHPKVFPEFFVNMVAIGEAAGSLDSVLESMADYYENDRKIKRKAKSAMTYPCVLLVLIVAVLAFITLFILPQFEETIRELGGDVPGITRALMNFSAFVRTHLIQIVLGIAAAVLVLFLFFRTRTGRYVKDWIKFHTPFLGKIERALMTSRFSKAFIILLESGMNITDCMENLRRMLGNEVFGRRFEYTIEEVKRGRRLAPAMENTKLFPDMLIAMIDVGERSGNIEEVLRSTCSYFDESVETAITRATTALEPMMIVLLGGVVAVVVLSVLLPMISLMSSI